MKGVWFCFITIQPWAEGIWEGGAAARSNESPLRRPDNAIKRDARSIESPLCPATSPDNANQSGYGGGAPRRSIKLDAQSNESPSPAQTTQTRAAAGFWAVTRDQTRRAIERVSFVPGNTPEIIKAVLVMGTVWWLLQRQRTSEGSQLIHRGEGSILRSYLHGLTLVRHLS